MVGIDRTRVQHAFDQHAGEYEAHACVQKRVITTFAARAAALALAPRRVLDIGSGTGLLLRELAGLYPTAQLIGVDLALGMNLAAQASHVDRQRVRLLTGDAERLPFRAETVDLALSTSTFQWLENLDSAFNEVHRVLRSGGIFSFALFGGKTLHELRSSYRRAWAAAGRGREERTLTFFSAAEVEEAMVRSGYSSCRVETELEVESHPDVPALLRSIRRVGAATTAPVASRGLSERRVMLAMMELYRRDYGREGMIPATYQVIYGVGMKE